MNNTSQNSSNDDKNTSKNKDHKQSVTSSWCSTSEISDLLRKANSVLYDEMASYSLPTTPHGVGDVSQLNFGTAVQLTPSPIVYGQGSIPLKAGVADGVMCEVLSKLNLINTKLAKLDTIENSLFQVTRRVNDIERGMEQLRNNFANDFETLK